MNNHIKDAWLEAYYDGELGNGRLQLAERHLAKCAECRTKLENLGTLSAILQESPGAENLTSASRFVAQVGLQLADRPSQPTWQRALVSGWRIIPAGLMGAWAFMQAVFLLVGLVLAIGRIGVGGEFARILAGLSPGSIQQAFLLNLTVTAITGICSLGWLASWWISQSNGDTQKSLIKNR